MHKSTIFILSASVLLLPALIIGQTVVATYQIHDHASGLAFDGINIWYGRYGTEGEKIYKFDTILEQVVDSLNLGASNLDDAYGMTWDGQYLWVTNHVGADFTLQIDTLGNIISSFQNPSDYMSGLAWNGSELYMGDYYNPDGAIYRVTTTGVILENFPAPDYQPWDLAWDGVYLWMCDYYSETIYQIDPITHNVIYSFLSPMQNPAGLAWDGNYLWVCDEGQGYSVDNLYKIEPFGGGTPEIQLSTDEFDFGFVPMVMTPYMTLGITNIGDADLTVSGMPIDQFGGDFWVDQLVSFPFTININSTVNVDIFYGPLNFGPSYGLLHVQSDDPINPDVTVDLNGYGIYNEQHVSVNPTGIDFGEVWLPQSGVDGMTGRPFEIHNLGAEPLNLISLDIDDPAFTQVGFEAGFLTSMDTTEITIYFTPTQAIHYSAAMTLTTDDPYEPIIYIPLNGDGVQTIFELGDIIWQYEVTEPSTFMGFNSIKYMDDVNGDGVNEVAAANDNYLTYCFNGQSAGTADVFYAFDTGWDPLRTGAVYAERGMVAAPDLNADGCGDIVLGTAGGSRSVFAVSGLEGAEIWSFDTHNFGGEGGWVYEVTCEDDWNDDDVYDVLAGVGGPAGSTEPKSVFLLDGTDGDIIWRAHLGETVYSVRRLEDVNGDDYAEVICGTVNNSSDYFVKRLNGQNGAVDWNHEVGYAVFSLNRIDDLNHDGVPDVAAAAGFAAVYALSGADGSEIWVHATGTGVYYYLEVTDDLNQSGFKDILVTSVMGTFYALEGRDGSEIWSLPLGSNVLSLAVTPDIDGDGIADACCGIMSGSFYAVSGADGSVLFSYIHGGGSSYAFDAVGWMRDIDNSGGIEFLGGTRDGVLYCFSGGDYTPPPTTVEISLDPLNPPIVIPPGGGTFEYLAEISNTGTQPVTFDTWIMVTLPNGSQYGPVLLRSDLTIPPLYSIVRTLTQNVPSNAPAGDYTYTGYVGNYISGEVWDEDSFGFTKSGFDAGNSGGGWTVTGWEDAQTPFLSASPTEFILNPAYPNPFNPATEISFALPNASEISLTVYNTLGQQAAVLAKGFMEAGWHRATFDGSNLASGLYLCTLKAEGLNLTRKMLLIK